MKIYLSILTLFIISACTYDHLEVPPNPHSANSPCLAQSGFPQVDGWKITELSGDLSDAQSLSTIHFLNEQVGYVGDFRQNIFKTTNAGDTWELVSWSSAIGSKVTGFHFINEQQGFALLNGKKLLKTTNAGATWKTIHCDVNGWIKDIYFKDTLNGFAISHKYLGAENKSISLFSKTIDGGATWEVSYAAKPSPIGFGNAPQPHMTFFDDERGLIMGENGLIYRTNDGAVSWTSEQIYDGQLSNLVLQNETPVYFVSNSVLYRKEETTNLWEKTLDYPPLLLHQADGPYGINLSSTDFCFHNDDTFMYKMAFFTTTSNGRRWKMSEEFNIYPSSFSYHFPSANLGYFAYGNKVYLIERE